MIHDRDHSVSGQPGAAQLGHTLPGLDPDEHLAETALHRWLRRDSPEPPNPQPSTDSTDPELEQMRSRLAVIKARAQLLRDPGWLDEVTPAEQDADRRAAAQIRTVRREQSLAAAMDGQKLGARARRVDTRLARIELADRLWSRRALARRARLLNPASRLAGLHRAHIASSSVLIGMAAAGIVWTSSGVHDAVVGPHGSTLAYLVEPIFSLPLLVIMAIAAHAAQWNESFPPTNQRGRVYALEVFLLTATIAMNTVSVLPRTGTWHNVATLLAHLVPPMLIVVAVVLQPLISGFLAGILTTTASATRGDTGPESTPLRLSAAHRMGLRPRLDQQPPASTRP